MHGFDGCPWETVVRFEQPSQNFFVLVAPVVKNCEQSWETLDYLFSGCIEKHLGNAWYAIALDGEKLAISEHLLDPGLGDFEDLAHVCELQQRNSGIQDIVGVRDCAH